MPSDTPFRAQRRHRFSTSQDTKLQAPRPARKSLLCHRREDFHVHGRKGVCLKPTEEKDQGPDVGGRGQQKRGGHCVTCLEPGHQAWAPRPGFN